MNVIDLLQSYTEDKKEEIVFIRVNEVFKD